MTSEMSRIPDAGGDPGSGLGGKAGSHPTKSGPTCVRGLGIRAEQRRGVLAGNKEELNDEATF